MCLTRRGLSSSYWFSGLLYSSSRCPSLQTHLPLCSMDSVSPGEPWLINTSRTLCLRTLGPTSRDSLTLFVHMRNLKQELTLHVPGERGCWDAKPDLSAVLLCPPWGDPFTWPLELIPAEGGSEGLCPSIKLWAQTH